MDIQAEKLTVHFIIGAGRSGTTLLVSMLNASQKVLAIPEAPIALYYYAAKRKQTRFGQQDRKDWVRMGERIPYIRKVGFDETPLVALEGKKTSYSTFVKASYLSLKLPGKDNSAVQFIVDKNPTYTYYVELLLRIFPQARFIAMMRHPLAQVNSSLENRNPYNKAHPPAFHAHSWQRYARELQRIQRKFPDRLKIVKYETLVGQPADTLSEICAFLDIPFQEQMLRFHELEQTTGFREDDALTARQRDRIKNKFKQLSKPVNQTRTRSWKEGMSPDVQAQILQITANGRKWLQYDSAGGHEAHRIPPISWRWNGLLIRLYFVFARRFYTWPVWWRERIRVKV
jgi:hypothetical protein